MLLAAYRGDAYRAVLLIHVLSVVITFAPVVFAPLFEKFMRNEGGDAAVQMGARFSHFYTSRVAMGSLVVALLTGIGMIVMSDEAIEFSDSWISVSFLVWFALAGVISAVIGKGERLLAEGDMSGSKLARTGGGIATVLLVIMLYLMIFKPGTDLL